MVISLNPLFGGSAFRTTAERVFSRADHVLIPFLAGLLFGQRKFSTSPRTSVLIPFLAGLLFGRPLFPKFRNERAVLIPFLAGLLFGPLSTKELTERLAS